ncbi:sigma-54-dependent Fis family transcriptional regulator [Desulfoluna spongiiphila]|uniref:sigma-54-dependent Fis family transcriptional regulator n=1 Tax=Desulfoluna spongiiphila TaxID=419481 RepID=UPI001257600B|nr:sigma-54-dependent Fis family transcriptional regulator [Desulfoluna spongiiphila]VVS90652.1 consensus disorder prediction [Desulfoluna spongiiphila]
MHGDLDEYKFFKEATLHICGSLHVQEAIDAFYTFIQDWIPCDEVEVGYYDNLTSTGMVLANATCKPELSSAPMARYSKSEWQRYRDALFSSGSDSFYINDFETADPIFALVERLHQSDHKNKSSLFIPLSMNDQDLGLIIITTYKAHAFTRDHTHLTNLLHAPFAIAMANWSQHLTLIQYKSDLEDDCRYFQKALRKEAGTHVIGSEGGLKEVMKMVAKVAVTDSPVMILGETGSGKEVIANAIHASSNRKQGPFIKVNCGAIPENLVDSELFGHEKGAFTGASKSHRGRFERASGGTLFLDEVGELPLHAQVRLLRVIQNQELERVGGTHPIPVDVRVISATHRDLAAMVKGRTFRQDLWFRLNVFPIDLPPLRNRPEDIPDLAHHFVIEKLSALRRKTPQVMTEGALDRLLSYSWPGNVRELQNVVERELILTPSGPLNFESLAPQQPAPSGQTDDEETPETLNQAMARTIHKALVACNGKVQGKGGAALRLGINPSTLRARMEKLGVTHKKKALHQT